MDIFLNDKEFTRKISYGELTLDDEETIERLSYISYENALLHHIFIFHTELDETTITVSCLLDRLREERPSSGILSCERIGFEVFVLGNYYKIIVIGVIDYCADGANKTVMATPASSV